MDNIYIKKEDLNKWVGKYFTKDLITIDDLISTIEELDDNVEELKQKIEDLEQDIEDNYKPISPYEMYGVSEHDFY